MIVRTRLLMMVLAAAFALASLLHAVNATAMPLEMALADTAAGDMTRQCDDCPGSDTAAPACGFICVAPFTATLATNTSFAPIIDAAPEIASGNNAPGLAGPPDPAPPKSILQS